MHATKLENCEMKVSRFVIKLKKAKRAQIV